MVVCITNRVAYRQWNTHRLCYPFGNTGGKAGAYAMERHAEKADVVR